MRSIVFKFISLLTLTTALVFVADAQQTRRTPFDVADYKMDVRLMPDDNRLAATVDVTFMPLEDTRAVSFELNGALKIASVTRLAAGVPDAPPAKGKAKPAAGPQATFVQDQVGVSELGPSVRVDLGDNVVKDTPVTLRFVYEGVLNSPNGGPLLTKRLAYIGPNSGYLMYAARWFPFNNYAADPATADINITIPNGLTAVGSSDLPVTSAGGKYRFQHTKPALIGNVAYGNQQNKTLRYNNIELQFYTKTGNDTLIAEYGEMLGKAFDHYIKNFGPANMGNKYIVAQIDDDSLDFYSAPGMLFISNRQYEEARPITRDRMQREAAIQWWGQTVYLKSFDDAWLSQGLAEYSAVSLREIGLSEARLDAQRRELLEKSLTFEQTASLLRAPANLDDQSTAYQYIMYGKGAYVYSLLRLTLGDAKFTQLLKTYLQEYRGKSASVYDFEKLASRVAGNDLRYFFARWVEGTGVPEFESDYLIIRTRAGKFVTRGTVKQNYSNLNLPVEVQLRSEGEDPLTTVKLDMPDNSADFNIESDGKPISVVIDPNYKLLRISPDLRVSSVARRGIEQMREGNYVEAQAQFEAALKLDRSNSWIYYHLGLLFLEQRNYDLAKDNFRAALGGRLEPEWLSVWSLIRLGNAYDAQGDRTRAVDAYNRAEKLEDDYDNAKAAIKKYLATPYDPRNDENTALN